MDRDARMIGEEIARSLPDTLGEAIQLYGPLQITHIIPREPNPDGWMQLYFLSSLRGKPDVFFGALITSCLTFVSGLKKA